MNSERKIISLCISDKLPFIVCYIKIVVKKKKCFVVGLKSDTNHVITRIFTPCNCKSKIEMESFLISTFE